MIRRSAAHLPYFFYIVAACIALGCSSSKRIAGDDSALKERSKGQLLKRLDENRYDFDHLQAKAKIRYDDGDQRTTFVANLRIKKDSFIWVNASFLNYEVARLLIRPDSIFLINRLEKSYMADSYSGFDSTFQIPVTFPQLQDLLYGNLLVDAELPMDVVFRNGEYLIKQLNGPYQTFHHINGSTFYPSKMQVLDNMSGYEVDLQLDDFKALEKSGYFAYFREYIIKNNNVHFANIQLNFTTIDTDEAKKVPFEIPEHYSRSD